MDHITINDKDIQGSRTMDTCKLLTATVLVAALSIPILTQAALVGRLAATEGGTDYQAYYDTEADLTWLADANAAGVAMNWADANGWAAALTVDGVDGWRLADTLQPDASCNSQTSSASYGYNCTGSEMGNLFYNVLGGNALSSITSIHNSNYDLFSNVQSSRYWSATGYAPGSNPAFDFTMYNGNQNYRDKLDSSYAWAVRSGDVSAVPVPAAIWLFGSGLIGLIGFANQKSHS